MSERKRKSDKLPEKSDTGAIVQQPVAQLHDRPRGSEEARPRSAGEG